MKSLSLPAPPSGWNELTAAQLETIQRLNRQRAHNIYQMGEAKANARFKLDVLFMLCGVKATRKGVWSDKENTTYYYIRRRGWRHLLESYPVEVWQIDYWAEHFLRFLDHPERLTTAPYPFVRVGRKLYKGPESHLVDITFEQYNNAQSYLVAYWDTADQLNKKIEANSVHGVKQLLREIEEYKSRFLATLFTPPVIQTLQTDENGSYKVNRTAYVYHASQDDHWKRFRGKKWEWIFLVMVQFVQGCLNGYKERFPDLFTSRKGNDNKDYIVIEADKMNGLKKYCNFQSYQDIYNSNMFFIMGAMNNMCQEAKQIEEMNRKMKRH